MTISANGSTYEIEPQTSLEAFVAARGLALERVVVERNGEALTPSEARETLLADGDRLEIVRIVAGG
jgi:sulfur carrier protein